jgi:adenylate kinase
LCYYKFRKLKYEIKEDVMKGSAIFIGGIHGAGKSTFCFYLERMLNCLTLYQRHLIIEVGMEVENLKTWDEIGPMHDRFIEMAAEKALQKQQDSHKQILLFDCHYAIRLEKALRARGKNISDQFIPDLDDKFVSILGNRLDLNFIFVDVCPSIACQRLKDRPLETLDKDTTLDGLSELVSFEKAFFNEKVHRFASKNESGRSYDLILENNGSFNVALSGLFSFIREHISRDLLI